MQGRHPYDGPAGEDVGGAQASIGLHDERSRRTPMQGERPGASTVARVAEGQVEHRRLLIPHPGRFHIPHPVAAVRPSRGAASGSGGGRPRHPDGHGVGARAEHLPGSAPVRRSAVTTSVPLTRTCSIPVASA